MPIQNSRYFNDPQIGQAFGNLSSMFAPPSGSDLSGYAAASAKKEEAARLAEMFNYAKDPNYDQKIADRMGVLGDLYDPNASYYSVDQGNITSRANNAATNAQSGLNTAATNRTTIEKTNLDNTNATTNTMLQPIAQGATRMVPPSLAALYGVDEQQAGMVSAAPGERVVRADGSVVEGQAKPLSETEWQAQQNARLLADGQLTDQQLADAVIGAQAPVKIVGADGRPQYSTPGAAARTGAQAPVAAGETAKVTNGQAVLPDGRKIPVYQTPGSGVWLDQSGRPVPPEAVITNMATPTGSNDELNLGPTKANVTAATNLEASLDAAEKSVNTAINLVGSNPNIAGVPGRIKGLAQSLASSAMQVSKAYATEAPDVAVSLDEARNLITTYGGGTYDQDVVRLYGLVADLAYARAQINNPTGEVSRQAFDRAMDQFGQGLLSSQQDLSVALQAFKEDTLKSGRIKVNTMRGQRGNNDLSGGAATPPAPIQSGQPAGGVEEWERGPDGKLQRKAN